MHNEIPTDWLTPPSDELTTFEWYMVADDSSSQPMTFTHAWHIQGQLHHERWQEALHASLKLHPLLHCKVQPKRENGRLTWVPSDSTAEITRLSAVDIRSAKLPPQWSRIDLSRSPGLKVAVIETPQDWLLILTFHHASADGLGSIEFASDLFSQYCKTAACPKISREEVENIEAKPNKRRRDKALNTKQLAQRHLLDRSIPHPVSKLEAIRFTFRETIRTLVFLPTRILRFHRYRIEPRDASGNLSTGFEQFLSSQLNLYPVRIGNRKAIELRRFATALGVTLHELLLAISFRSIGKLQLGLHSIRRTIAAVLPVNMRRSLPDRTPCHNGIGYAFIRRTIAQSQQLERNVQSLAEEMKAIQLWHLGGVFIDMLAKLQGIPLWLARFLIRRTRPATFVLSFLGELNRRFPTRLAESQQGLDLKDCTIVDFAAAPPTRSGTDLAIFACSIKDELTLWLRTEGGWLTPSDVRLICEAVHKEVDQCLAPASSLGQSTPYGSTATSDPG